MRIHMLEGYEPIDRDTVGGLIHAEEFLFIDETLLHKVARNIISDIYKRITLLQALLNPEEFLNRKE